MLLAKHRPQAAKCSVAYSSDISLIFNSIIDHVESGNCMTLVICVRDLSSHVFV